MKMLLISIAVVVSTYVVPLHAAMVINGSLDSPGLVIPSDPNNMFNRATASPWVQFNNYQFGSDLFDPTISSLNGFSWVSSNDGGLFTHALGGLSGTEGIVQTITGLVPGMQYDISFEQSSGDAIWTTTGIEGHWKVLFGSEVHYSNLLLAQNLNAWTYQTLRFTATSSTQDLSFVAESTSAGRVDLAIDGISVSAVPLPATLWLFISGFIVISYIARRKDLRGQGLKGSEPFKERFK